VADIDVSVITPTFRREKQVVDAIKSALEQPLARVEVLVLDADPAGSAETAVLAFRDPRVRYVRCQTPGDDRLAAAQNEGSRLAHGHFLHFLEDDHRLAEGALAALVGALERTPNVGVAFGNVTPVGEDAAVLAREEAVFAETAELARRRLTRLDMTACLLFKLPAFVGSACLIRRENALALGGYDETIASCRDIEFYARAIREFGFVFVDRPVSYSSAHDLVMRSHQGAHDKYRRARGNLEFYAMKMLAKVF